MTGLWEDERSPFEDAFDAAAKRPPWHKVIHTHQHHPCKQHTEPAPEMFTADDGTKVEVTEALRARWDWEGVTLVIRRRFVGTCYTNGCRREAEW